MELHSNLYYKHSQINVMRQLDMLFKEHQGREQAFIKFCN